MKKKVEKHDEKKNPDQVEKHDFFDFWWSQQFYQVLKFFHETRLRA